MKTYTIQELRERLIEEIKEMNEELVKELCRTTGDELISNGENEFCIKSELTKEELADLTRFDFLD